MTCGAQAAAEHFGVSLTAQELAFFDVVVTAHIVKDGNKDDEGRTAWADEIEREDMLAEERKKRSNRCICS